MSMFCLHKEYQEAVYLVTLSSKLQCLNLRGNESLVSQSASVLQSVSDLCRLWSRRDLWRCRDSHGTWHSENYSPPVRSCQLLSVPVSHSLLWAYVADVAYAAAVAPVSHGSGLSFILFQSAQLLGLLRVDHEADEKGIDAIEHAQDPRPPQSPWSWFNIVSSHCLILSRPGWTPCSKIFRQSLHVHLPCSLECAHWPFSRSWQWLIPESFA